MQMPRSATTDRRADLLGIACSAGCAVHCATLPAIATVAPAMGLSWLAGSLVHQIAAVVCCLLVAKAILPAWRRHRDQFVAVCVSSGLVLLLLAAFVLPDPCCEPTSVFGWFGVPLLSVSQIESWLGGGITDSLLFAQPYLTPIGGVLLIAAHVMNLDLVRRQERRSCGVPCCLPSTGC